MAQSLRGDGVVGLLSGDDLIDALAEGHAGDGFGEEAAAADETIFGDFGGGDGGGEEDGGDVLEGGVGLEGGDDIAAVHTGHDDVDEDEIGAE